MKFFLNLIALLLLTPLAASTAAQRKPFLKATRAWVNANSWADIVQLTSQPVIGTSGHMKQRFTSADRRQTAIEQQPFGQPLELWGCDLNTKRLYRIGAGRAMPPSFSRNAIDYLTPSPETWLMRVDLEHLSTRQIMAIPRDALPPVEKNEPDTEP